MLANRGHTDWITVNVLLARNASDIVSSYGNISMTQYRILIRLAMQEGIDTVTGLAQALCMSAPTISNCVSALESCGAAKRVYADADRRVVHIDITEVGRELLAEIDPPIIDLAHQFWSDYTDEEKELTFKDSTATAVDHGLAYYPNGKFSVEHAYVDSAGVVLAELGRHMRRANMSLSEYRVLYLLHEREHAMRPSEICRKLLLRSNEVTLAVSKLEKHGRVSRSRNAHDHRSCELSITETGFAKLERVTPPIVESLQNSICTLDDGAFEMYDDIADKILTHAKRIHLIG